MRNRKFISLAVVFALGLVVRLWALGWQPFPIDMNCWLAWGQQMCNAGPGGFYTDTMFADYAPGYLYVLWITTAFKNTFFAGASPATNHFLYRLPSILFDFATAGLIFFTVEEAYRRWQFSRQERLANPVLTSGKKRRAKEREGELQESKSSWLRVDGVTLAAIAALCHLLNPGIFFNSAAWGQVDASFTFLLVLSLTLLLRDKPEWAVATFMVAFYVKPQSVSLAPLIGVVLLMRYKPVRWFALLGVGVVVSLAILFPFFSFGSFFRFVKLMGKSVEVYPYTSMYMYNLWSIFYGFWTNDTLPFVVGISRRTTGTLLYVTGIIGGCIMLVRQLRRTADQTHTLYFFAAYFTLLPVMVLTRMHERYLYPALPFLLVFAFLYAINNVLPRRRELAKVVLNKVFLLYVLVSTLHIMAVYYVYTYYIYFDTKATVPRDNTLFYFIEAHATLWSVLMLGSFVAFTAMVAKWSLPLRARASFAEGATMYSNKVITPAAADVAAAAMSDEDDGDGDDESSYRAPKLRANDARIRSGFDAAPRITDSLIDDRTWRLASYAVFAVAAFLRIYMLALKPLHHDEGVNGFFLTNLIRNGVYHYDPANYHGPTLYYLALPFTIIMGLSTWAIRMETVFFGLGVVALALCLSRYIGRVGALTAALLLAVSPGMVYNARYFIHESLFVCFTLGIVVTFLRYHETGRPLYLLLTALSAALLFATKETAFISVGVLLIATAMSHFYVRWRERQERVQSNARRANKRASKIKGKRNDEQALAASGATNISGNVWERFGSPSQVGLLVLAGVAIFVVVNVVFYSSFFTYKAGVAASLETFKIWTKTGTSDFHSKPFDVYFWWLVQEESLLVLLACIGAAFALFKGNNRFALFAALWAGGITLAYSLVPYKTPWLALNFIVPLAITAGYGIEQLFTMSRRDRSNDGRLLAVGLLGAAVAVASYQTVVLNFYHYDDDKYPYVYAHSRRDLTAIVEEIDRLAIRSGKGKDIRISIATPEYWPMPWYMRDYKAVAYPGQQAAGTNEDIVIVGKDQADNVEKMLGEGYKRSRVYDMRPGVELVMFTKRELG